MRHASLFSGIGGFDLAAEWMGWENVFNCEIDPFCQKVLKYHFPDALQFGDIKLLKFKKDEHGNVYVRRTAAYTESTRARENNRGIWERFSRNDGGEGTTAKEEKEETWHNIGTIDIISGGFPCQPFSIAGKRRGTDDDRHLWPEMLRAIREIQPTWVVGENVYGLINWNGGMVFDEIISDLENEGYEVQPFIIPACAVNAPHRRDRVWIVAKNTRGDGCRDGKFEKQGNIRDERESCTGGTKWDIGGSDEIDGITPDTEYNGLYESETQRKNITIQCQSKAGANLCNLQFKGTDCIRENGGGNVNDEGQNASDTNGSERQKGGMHQEGRESTERHTGKFNPRTVGDWADFPTVSPLCKRNDGLSFGLSGITFSKWRNESIKALGNAVVPPLVYQIFKTIDDYERLYGNKAE